VIRETLNLHKSMHLSGEGQTARSVTAWSDAFAALEDMQQRQADQLPGEQWEELEAKALRVIAAGYQGHVISKESNDAAKLAVRALARRAELCQDARNSEEAWRSSAVAAEAEVKRMVEALDGMARAPFGEFKAMHDRAMAAEAALADANRERDYWKAQFEEYQAANATYKHQGRDLRDANQRANDYADTLRWYGERRNYLPPAGSETSIVSPEGWVGSQDSFDGNGPGARARAALDRHTKAHTVSCASRSWFDEAPGECDCGATPDRHTTPAPTREDVT
jgi:hypothetical protein